MEAASHRLSREGLEAAFPFLLVLDEDLTIRQFGASMAKAVPDLAVGDAFERHFRFARPPLGEPSLAAIRRRPNAVFTIHAVACEAVFRGQLLVDPPLEPTDAGDVRVLFLGSPWVTDLAQVERMGLGLRDFAVHDPVTDFLFLLRTRDASLADAKRLAERLREQGRVLEQARDEAERADRAKSQFLSNVSHELRTPLNGVIGLAQVLLGAGFDGEVDEQLRMIEDSAQQLRRVVEDILDMSMLEAGRVELRTDQFGLREVLEDVIERFRDQAVANEARLDLQIDARVPRIAIGDEQRVRHVFSNLVGNAIKFTGSGSVELEASVDVQDTAEWLSVAVRDSGPGIPEAVRKQIFDPFVQADGTPTRAHGGTGLGLAITRRLVELMGGAMELDSVAGVGSEFRVRLPLTRPAPDSVPEPMEPRPECPVRDDARRRFRGRRVLLAEDNRINQRVAVAMLKRFGCRCEVVEDGLAAIEALQSRRYDLVLMDYQMPRMDGVEATRSIRAAESDSVRIPIVALTANARDEDRRNCFAAGMDDFLAKPVGFDRLGEVLARWFRPA